MQLPHVGQPASLAWEGSQPQRCPALQNLRDKRPHLFDGAQTDAMLLFMWQDDMIGVVRFIDECLERILYTSDQP